MTGGSSRRQLLRLIASSSLLPYLGLPDAWVALADRGVHVPILGRAESLNLATAAAVCLYASAREQG